MLKKSVVILIAGFLLIATFPACNSIGSSLENGNKVGNLAPDFALKDLDGNIVSLSSLAGQPVMLNFWNTG
jgi:hypothetical protein